MGDESKAKVAEANTVRDRAVFLLLVLWYSGRKFVVEQPISSLINRTEPFRMMLEVVYGKTVTFDHAAHEDEEIFLCCF